MPTPISPSPDTIRTPTEPCGASILVHGSKFIAWLAPATSENEATVVLETRRRQYPDATHHCWAHRVGRPGDLIERSADAGEPSGTAGRPILDSLRHGMLENAVCIVTRYFGGTKLGTGGLARAYAEAASDAIAAASVIERTIVQTVAIDFDHERTGPLFRVLDEFGLHLVPGAYDERGHGTVEVPVSKADALKARLHELARTGIELHPGDLLIV
jgi:uncharacterized YigZ family protein